MFCPRSRYDSPLAVVVRDAVYAGELGRVSWGRAEGGFAPIAALLTPEANGPSVGLAHVDLDDLDRDGWLDVLIASRYCNDRSSSLIPLLRVAPRRYEAHREIFPDGAPLVSSYSVQVAEFLPGEKLINVTGQPCFGTMSPRSFLIERGAGEDGRPRFALFDPIPRDSYFNSLQPGRTSVVADFSPMASAVGDLNGDGLLDLAISLDPHHAFYEHRGAWPFADVTERVGFPEVRLPSGSRMIPWGIALLDLDRDGRPDVVTTHGNDQSAWYETTALIGPQHTTAHLNNGDRPFVDVSERLGLTRLGQWRALTVGDLDRDGAPDLVVGGQGEMPRVYRNAIRGPNAGLALRLRGTTSNHLGVGARVTVLPRPGAPEQLHVASSVASPYAYAEPLVFVGLGGSAPASRVSIRWPSGVLQVLRDLAPGTLHEVVEPSLLTVDPPSRRVDADGVASVTIRITPRAEDGSLRAATAVTVALRGAGTLAQPARPVAEGWEARVVAARAGLCGRRRHHRRHGRRRAPAHLVGLRAATPAVDHGSTSIETASPGRRSCASRKPAGRSSTDEEGARVGGEKTRPGAARRTVARISKPFACTYTMSIGMTVERVANTCGSTRPNISASPRSGATGRARSDAALMAD